jgi:hypothetical protein
VQGESIDTVERALHGGGFHPALAHEAVRWAREQQRELDDDTPEQLINQASLPAPVPRR